MSFIALVIIAAVIASVAAQAGRREEAKARAGKP
jgi:archaellin